ncbi:sensor histidine kinase [Paenibacillus glycanilyticus]|uniref:sensor histidine kinase n=1 Tax=Paenibacillus glycanilyticus TaxID=126569 RepID=UPI00203EE6BC|nr:histidine kinase [Paenibacillus glycanilyticus]MCM3626734.1 sensor histidine kinase [Paenibacillus glycanilyticus]
MINKERSLFSKLVGALILLLVPVLIVSVYSNRVNERVITQQIKESSTGRVSTLAAQMDHIIMQMETYSQMLIRDPNVIEFQDLSLLTNSYYEQVKRKKVIQDKLYLQSASTNWVNDITVYSPHTGETLSTVHGIRYETDRLEKLSRENWNFVWNVSGSGDKGRIIHLTYEPHIAGGNGISQANSIIEISFDMSNVIRLLDQFQSQGSGDALFYKNKDDYLAANSIPPTLLKEALSLLNNTGLHGEGDITLYMSGISYLLAYSKVESLDGYVVNIVPLHDILTPLRKSNQFDYLVLGLLLIVGIAVSWILYRNVQMPLRALVKGVQQIKMGQYKSRILFQASNEFRLIISRFNEMADQIQTLIENVLEQKLHAREAELKQLQSQINPHFLYNSISYMISMTKLDKKEAVLQMAYHLSDYYRYSTHVERQLVDLGEELKNAKDYLEIHRLRMKRINYVIRVDPDMMNVKVPRLFLQPIVENALIHGIENLEDIGLITIAGSYSDGKYKITVEDNGGTMTHERLQSLKRLLVGRFGEGADSCGLQNVNRRLQLRYGEDAGLHLSINRESGLRVELRWREEPEKDEAVNRRR